LGFNGSLRGIWAAAAQQPPPRVYRRTVTTLLRPSVAVARGSDHHQDVTVRGIGSGGRIRTTDQGLMSPLLYH
jgi:hypothetical protein